MDGHGCARAGHTQELIKIAREIQDEFATRITRRESWVEHENPDATDDSAGKGTDLEAYLGTQYLIDLKKPRTRNELQTLTNQIEALSHHFDELTYPLKELKPGNTDDKEETKDGGQHKEMWTGNQVAIFEDLKTILFDIVKGNHVWTRNARVNAYHPHVATPPGHTDTCKIIIQSTFGGKGGTTS